MVTQVVWIKVEGQSGRPMVYAYAHALQAYKSSRVSAIETRIEVRSPTVLE
jgi:hypothetical protein